MRCKRRRGGARTRLRRGRSPSRGPGPATTRTGAARRTTVRAGTVSGQPPPPPTAPHTHLVRFLLGCMRGPSAYHPHPTHCTPSSSICSRGVEQTVVHVVCDPAAGLARHADNTVICAVRVPRRLPAPASAPAAATSETQRAVCASITSTVAVCVNSACVSGCALALCCCVSKVVEMASCTG